MQSLIFITMKHSQEVIHRIIERIEFKEVIESKFPWEDWRRLKNEEWDDRDWRWKRITVDDEIVDDYDFRRNFRRIFTSIPFISMNFANNEYELYVIFAEWKVIPMEREMNREEERKWNPSWRDENGRTEWMKKKDQVPPPITSYGML